MKNLLFALIMGASLGASAQTELSRQDADLILSFDTTSEDVFRYVGSETWVKLDCEPYETFSPWEVKSEGNATRVVHSHSWVYAEREDVNPSSGITNMVYCPCGCPQSEIQARICSECLRHETRLRNYGFRQVEREESEYVKLKKKIKG